MTFNASPNTDPVSGSCSGSGSIPYFNSNGIPNYIFMKQIGSGGFGDVNLMKHCNTGKLYAVKKIKKTSKKNNDKTRFEIDLGMKLNSDYVCRVQGYHEDDEFFFIFMEYLGGVDLFDFIVKYPKFFLEKPEKLKVVLESILRGLVYLHSKRIAHFDVKPENIVLLFDGEGIIIGAKLIDLGLSMEVNETTRVFLGTPKYMAPEFFHFCRSTELPTDIWSLGITLYAMIMASFPISSNLKDPQQSQKRIFKKIESLLSTKRFFNPFEKLSDDPSIRDIQSIILSCFAINPKMRPTAKQLLDYILSTDSSKAQNNP
jgi:serine/threonine protein kinase